MKHVRFGKPLALFAAALLSGAALSAAELTLAEGGKTKYKIVVAPNAEAIDKEAAADLAATLKEITGADFSDAAGKEKSIFVGTAAPGDKTPLKEFERRITTQDGNLYIYGEGEIGRASCRERVSLCV